MADLLKEIEAQIAGARATTALRQNVGVIREIGDGVARVEGLSDAMLNEMLDLGHGITGLALNLEETEVGVIILGEVITPPMLIGGAIMLAAVALIIRNETLPQSSVDPAQRSVVTVEEIG